MIGRRRSRALTLLELLAVITVIGLIAAIVVPRVSMSGLKAKIHVCQQYKADLNTAVEKYLMYTGNLPDSVDDLQDDLYYPDEIPVCPVTNEPYALDPVSKRIAGHDHPL